MARLRVIPDRLHDTTDDQEPDILGCEADKRAEHEAEKPDQEHGPSAEAIGE